MIKVWLISLILINSTYAFDGDYTPSFNELAKKACESDMSRTINIGQGEFHFKTKPNPFPCALNIKGDGIGSTFLIREYQAGAFLHWMRGQDHSGGSIKDVSIAAGKGTNGGIAIYVQADKDTDSLVNSYNRHTFTISNITIGREVVENTSWDHGIYLDGSLNPDNNDGIAPGIRMTQVISTTISGTRVSQVYINKGRGINLLNLDCFIPLNGSFNGVMLDNVTQGVKLDSRTCPWKFQDDASIWMVYNGFRYR